MNEITLEDLQKCRDEIYNLLFSGEMNPGFKDKFACYLAVDNLVMRHLGLKETNIEKYLETGVQRESQN